MREAKGRELMGRFFVSCCDTRRRRRIDGSRAGCWLLRFKRYSNYVGTIVYFEFYISPNPLFCQDGVQLNLFFRMGLNVGEVFVSFNCLDLTMRRKCFLVNMAMCRTNIKFPTLPSNIQHKKHRANMGTKRRYGYMYLPFL